MLEYKPGPSVGYSTEHFGNRMFIAIFQGPEGMHLILKKRGYVELLVLHALQIVLQISFFSMISLYPIRCTGQQTRTLTH